MSDRHDKWTRVEPGTVIPAGQPYRIEFPDGSATESPNKSGHRAGSFSQPGDETFIDSSWKPPLVLPTEPTWGIALVMGTPTIGKWTIWNDLSHYQWFKNLMVPGKLTAPIEKITGFIPLTDEQVARIEAAR